MMCFLERLELYCMLIIWRKFMSPQTETKTSSGFKAGVKDYRLFLI